MDLARWKEEEDAALKTLETMSRLRKLIIYKQLYAEGIRIFNIDHDIVKTAREEEKTS